jgi:hypothetical protein
VNSYWKLDVSTTADGVVCAGCDTPILGGRLVGTPLSQHGQGRWWCLACITRHLHELRHAQREENT